VGGYIQAMDRKNHLSDTVKRANYIAGHVKSVSGMLENGAYCIDVIHQLDAIGAAISKLRHKVLTEHLNTCVISSIRDGDKLDREKAISELLTVYEKKG
jgi:CsoR family transcriptional regulator, copper-sensing transcriptional repressor